MAVPDNTTFNMMDVTTTIYDDSNPGRNLSDCFIDAQSSWFNPLYSGTKDQLLNFRDYKNPGQTPHYIGDEYEDGILWNISADGTTGIICDKVRNSTNIWANDYQLVDVTHQEMGWGLANTQAIVDFYPSYDFLAAHVCYNKGGGWFLPTLDELDTLLRVALYGNYPCLKFLTEVTNYNHYWSSSEHDEESAWYVCIENNEVNFATHGKISFRHSIACRYVTF